MVRQALRPSVRHVLYGVLKDPPYKYVRTANAPYSTRTQQSVTIAVSLRDASPSRNFLELRTYAKPAPSRWACGRAKARRHEH
jgi:hypothetical protein